MNTALKMTLAGAAVLVSSAAAFAQVGPGGDRPTGCSGGNCPTTPGQHQHQHQQQSQVINNPKQAPGIGGGISPSGNCGEGIILGGTAPGAGAYGGVAWQSDRCHDRIVAAGLTTDPLDCLNRVTGRETLGQISNRFANAMAHPVIKEIVDAAIKRCLAGYQEIDKNAGGYGERRPAAAARRPAARAQ